MGDGAKRVTEPYPFRSCGTTVPASAPAGSPKYMACVPAQAIEGLQAQVNCAIDDILDLIEINEAFAAVTLVSLKMLAKKDGAKWQVLQQKCNVNGGAIAIGHPVGASGAHITMALMY